MSSPLLALPSELLEHIMHHVAGEIRFRTGRDPSRLRSLVAVSQTSRRLHSSVEPFLYRQFSSYWSPRRVRHFLRAICETPRLSKHLQVDGLKTRDVPDIRPDLDDYQLYREAMKQFSEWELHDALLDALSRGCLDATGILVLLLTTNIRQLRLEPDARAKCSGPRILDGFVSFLAWSSSVGRMNYRNLKEISVEAITWRSSGGDPSVRLRCDSILQLMRLPSLRRLTVDAGVVSTSLLASDVGFSRVSHLCLLNRYGHDPLWLCHLVNACSSLIQLKLDGIEDIPLFSATLQRHRDTLEELSVVYAESCTFELCDIQAFKRLHRLELQRCPLSITEEHPICDALRLPTLPATLRHLAIQTGGCLDDVLASVAQNLQQFSAGLEILTVSCTLFSTENAKYLDLIQELKTGNAKVPSKPGIDWIISIREDSLDLVFQCLKGKKTISETASDVVHVANSSGVSHLLSEYYADWPPYDSGKSETLRELRELVREQLDLLVE